jgi:hypothetical protein
MMPSFLIDLFSKKVANGSGTPARRFAVLCMLSSVLLD